MRLTGLAHDAVSSLNWLAGHEDSSPTPRTHVESMDKMHSAFWRDLCDEALRRQSTAPSERQETDAVPSALLKTDVRLFCLVLPRELGLLQENGCFSLSSEVHDCPHIFDVVGSTGRWYLEEEQQRMRQDPEEIEEPALPQVCNDQVLKRSQNLYHSVVRDVKSRGMLSATLSPPEHVGMFVREDQTPT